MNSRASRSGRITAKLLLGALILPLLIGSFSCSRRTGETAPPAGITRSESEEILTLLRERTSRTRTFRCRGTVLLEWETERHFIHFTAHFARPGRLRLDLDGGGPLGIGSGRLTYVERPDSLGILLPGESEPVRRGGGADVSDLLDTRGLLTRDGAYLFAPYPGDPDLFRPSRLVTFGIDRRTGNYRLVLKRTDGNHEVIFVEPEGHSLVARRVVRPDGTVLLVSLYEFGDDAGALKAERVSNRVPGEESSIEVRFHESEWNVPIEEKVFQWQTSMP